jgi:hypothetical protein
MSTPLFTPHTCSECGQTTDYDLPLDKGSAMIVMAVANAVRRLNKNSVHFERDMLGTHEGGESYFSMIRGGYMTPMMARNIARPRYHGLIAFVEKGTGEYLLTRKGADFIRGAPVKRIALIDKVLGKNAGYLETGGETTIHELLRKETPMWAANLEELRTAFAGEEMTASML